MSVTFRPISGRDLEILVTSTAVDSDTEVMIDLSAVPSFSSPLRKIRLQRAKAVLNSGSAASIAPALTRAAAGEGTDIEWSSEAAETHDRNFPGGAAIYAVNDKLWLKWNPDTGNDNTCSAQLLITNTWD